MCGDFNSRIGMMKDYSEFDSIRGRNIIDKTTNQHGKSFIEFFNESKMCVLNGRFDPNDDNFTCISGRGKSVVDYICVPHEVLKLVKSFKVISAKSIVENANLFHLIGERSRVPYHFVLLSEIKIFQDVNNNQRHVSDAPKRYKLKLFPNDFLSQNNVKSQCKI